MLTPTQQPNNQPAGASPSPTSGLRPYTPPTPQNDLFDRLGIKLPENANLNQKFQGKLDLPEPVNQIYEAAKGGIGQMGQAFKESLAGRNPIETGAKLAAGGIQTLASPIAPLMTPVNEAVQQVADKISNIPEVQKFAQGKGGEIASRIAEFLGNLSTVAGATVGGEEAVAPKETMVPESVTPRIGVPGGTPNVAGETEALQNAIKDATPAYSKKLIGEPSVKTEEGQTVPRVQEGGIFKGRQITSTALEKEAGAELSRVPGYDPKATNLEKYNLVKTEIGTRSQNLKSSLENEHILRPPKEIRSVVKNAVNEVPHESLLLQKSDPVIKNYMRVLDNAIVQSDGTLAGELDVRQLMDQAYSNARGKLAFGSDKISALDDVHSAARDALNQDLIDNARSTDVKASLRSQWNLYRALDVLKSKAEVEGNSSIERLMNKFPKSTNIVKAGVKAAGLGAGLHALP